MLISPNINFDSCLDEIEKIALDPAAIAAMAAGGKIIGANFLHRYGQNIPGVRQLGQGIAGIGLRTGMQGKPMLHPITRAVGGVLGDPSLMGAYEHSHQLGSTLGAEGITKAKQMIPMAKNMGLHVNTKLIDGIRTDSTGIRKVMDYGFTPVSQVGRDIRTGVSNMAHRAASLIPKALKTNNSLQVR